MPSLLQLQKLQVLLMINFFCSSKCFVFIFLRDIERVEGRFFTVLKHNVSFAVIHRQDILNAISIYQCNVIQYDLLKCV